VASPEPAPVEPAPEPEGTAAEAPVEQPAPAPAAAPAGPAPIRLNIEAEGVTIVLRTATGGPVDMGALTPGSYRILAAFDPAQPDKVKEVGFQEFAAGQTVNIKCSKTAQRCVVSVR